MLRALAADGRAGQGRVIQFASGSIAALKTLPGYSDFDPLRELLHCDKPGTGLKTHRRRFH